MSEEVARALLRAGCLLQGEFKLSSGGTSRFYVDVRRLYSHPREAKLVAGALAEAASRIGCDVVAGVESGGIPLATMVAFLLDKPLVYVRKKPKEHGTQRMIEGDPEVKGVALVVDDVATTGSSILRAAAALREAGFTVRDALVVVDREEGAARTLSEAGIRLHSLLKLGDLLSEAGVGANA